MKHVPFTDVKLSDNFWAPRVETNRQTTLDIQYNHLIETGRIAGLDPRYKPGDHTAHHPFWDSDIAKWMETAAYALATQPDPELEAKLDAVIEKFAELQGDDGYTNSWITAVEPSKRFANLRDTHELYCAGHLIEAAVAHFRATGKRHFLDIVCRYADYIDSVFGRDEGKLRGYPGHEEIELALVKLFDVTGNERYLRLAEYFIDERGQQPHYFDIEARRRGEDPAAWRHKSYEYNQSHVPVREQSHVVGHAVRAMYLYCGMADIARLTGDTGLVDACERIWSDVTRRHLYLTGGIGQSRTNEGFTKTYDLPEETAYCETCAAIGLVLWNHRMLQLTGEGRFADCMERGLYNGTISGVSLTGDRFFYDNPLASAGGHHRQEWFNCACCPGNISRLIASVSGFYYSVTDDAVWIHLYGAGEAHVSVAGCQVKIKQGTAYPWDGDVTISVNPEHSADFGLALRIPGWCRRAELSVNGQPLEGVVARKGYVTVKRRWRSGDTLVLALEMPVERMYANPKVRSTNGKVALQRGPVVYCLEQVDNPFTPLNRVALPRASRLTSTFEGSLLGGVVTLSGEAMLIEDDGDQALYRSTPIPLRPAPIKLVPYCVWDNREPGEMLVWLREQA